MSKLAGLFLVALTVRAVGASPVALAGVPPEDSSDHTAVSAAARLGIKYEPPARNADRAFVAPPSNDPMLPEPLLLEPFIVNGTRAKLTERAIMTDGARLKIAKDRTLSPLYRYTFGPLAQLASYYFNPLGLLFGWRPNDAEAEVLYRQEERLEMLGEMDSLMRLEKIGGSKDTKLLQRVRFGAVIDTR